MGLPSRQFDWNCRGRTVPLGARTLIMGVVNVTPDSFSDGGRFLDPERAVEHALDLAANGADVLDIGGESTRPGSEPVAVSEELRRVLPVIQGVAASTSALISVDTSKAEVARDALAAGAHVVNDVSAGRLDPDLFGVAAEAGAGLVLMHMRGTPRTMQENPVYADVVSEVADHLAQRAAAAEAAGVARAAIVLDPGIGFGKTVEHNLALLAGLPDLAELGYPLLVGLSRKSFLGVLTGRPPDERLAAGLGALAFCVTRGVHIMRVHDVKESCDAAKIVEHCCRYAGASA